MRCMHHMETVGGTYCFHGSGAAVNWRHPHILLTSVLTGCRDCNPTARNVAGDAEDCSSMKSYCLIIRPSVGPNFCYPLWSQRRQTDGHCLLYSSVVCHINRPLHNAPLPAVSTAPLASDPKRWLQPNPGVLSISCQKICRCCVWSKPVYYKIDGLWFW